MKHPWIQTIQSEAIDLELITDTDFNIPMIAHSLGMLCRYNGHCAEFYSVAEHSVHCARAATRVHGRASIITRMAFLHDAHECVIGDITSPVKAMFRAMGADLAPWENYLQALVYKRFLGTYDPPEDAVAAVKAIDNTVLIWEKEQIMTESPRPWEVPYDGKYAPGGRVRLWGPTAAATYFNEMSKTLKIE